MKSWWSRWVVVLALGTVCSAGTCFAWGFSRPRKHKLTEYQHPIAHLASQDLQRVHVQPSSSRPPACSTTLRTTTASMTDCEDSNKNVLEWTPLNPESLVAAPCLIEQTLCCPTSSNPFQLAKDINYARAVLDAWREDDPDATWTTEWTSVTYSDNDKGTPTPLYGHLVRQRTPADFPATITTIDGANRSDDAAIGILICHTGAGPHDLFLLWKAASLVQELATDLAQQQQQQRRMVVVLIADLLSDESGWAWQNQAEDRTRYAAARQELLLWRDNDHEPQEVDQDDASVVPPHKNYHRPVLESRLRAAEAFLRQQLVPGCSKSTDDDNDDEDDQGNNNNNVRIAALGWCLGGHAVVELARMRLPSVCAMVTFHGVFDGIPSLDESDTTAGADPVRRSEILICHGLQDPFVSSNDMEQALATFQHYGHTTSLLQLKDAKHGFTNPAQDFNDDDHNNNSFAYHRESADKAWRHALGLLKRRLLG